MSDDASLLLTASIEKVACLAVPVLLLVLWLATRRRRPEEPVPDRPGERVTPSEAGLLFLVLAAALVLRLLWWDQGLPGTIFGGEVITARVDLAVQRGGLWTRWWELIRSPNAGGWLYDSVIVEPVVAAFQMVFPPEIRGIVRVGALFGVAAVALAWLAGRLLHGPRFALLFAAFVAISPLQVVWSRLGYRAMAATPHILLALALAALAARRGSYILAALAGIVSYATVYNYEAARVAIPLSILALWTATRLPVRRNLRFLVLSLVVAAVVVTLTLKIPRASYKSMLWPTYAGYAGNQGERTLGELIERNYMRAEREGRRSLTDYFLVSRSSPPRPSITTWGIAYGGNTFLPIAVLGGLGLIVALAAPSRHLIWYATVLLGLALPAMACSSARRLLVFDLGWCAFAAIGLSAFGRTPPLSRLPRAARLLLACAFLGAMGTWTLAAIAMLRDGPGYRGVSHVPFGTGCVGDVTTCPRCVDAGKQWEADIRQGKLVMLVDADMSRENPTAPAGLPLYGGLAAATAGARDRFQELYPILWNVNFIPEFRHYYSLPGDPMRFITDLLQRTPHRGIVWHAERPMAWDRWLAGRLVEVGGTMSTFSSPLASDAGFRVETTEAEEPAILRLLAPFGATAADGTRPCITATPVKTEGLPFPPHSLAVADTSTDAAPPLWFALGWNQAAVANGTWALPSVRQIARGSRAGASQVRVLRGDGYEDTYAWPSRARGTSTRPLTDLMPIGRACGAFAGGDWWVVEPERGALKSQIRHEWIPRGEWMGLASDGADELVLAAADQRIVVLDLANRVVKSEFPAPVTPSRAEEFGECTQIARGPDWIGVHQAFANRLDVYADSGRRLGAIDLARLNLPWSRAVGAAGRFLAVGQASQLLTTLKLDLGACGPVDATPPL